MAKLILAAILAIMCAMPCAGAENAENMVRLHVIAESDSIADQTFKMRVRGEVLKVLGPVTAGIDDPDVLFAVLQKNADAMEAAANAQALREGRPANIRAEVGIFAFTERRLGAETVPAGDYRAMRIVIGTGSGHNWWCALYPDLVTPDDGGETIYYSAIIEFFAQLFGA